LKGVGSGIALTGHHRAPRKACPPILEGRLSPPVSPPPAIHGYPIVQFPEIMKRLIVPPAGPPGPIPADVAATEPPKSQPEHSLALDPNDAPLPSTGTESSSSASESAPEKEKDKNGEHPGPDSK
jgi:hypothetical protein